MAIQRMIQAGAIPITWMVFGSELQRDWARTNTAPAIAKMLVEHAGVVGTTFVWEQQLLVTPNTPGALAAKRATSTIPIVIIAVGDPVGSGIVQTHCNHANQIIILITVQTTLPGDFKEIQSSLLWKRQRRSHGTVAKKYSFDSFLFT